MDAPTLDIVSELDCDFIMDRDPRGFAQANGISPAQSPNDELQTVRSVRQSVVALICYSIRYKCNHSSPYHGDVAHQLASDILRLFIDLDDKDY
jgi:hypothetical protein